MVTGRNSTCSQSLLPVPIQSSGLLLGPQKASSSASQPSIMPSYQTANYRSYDRSMEMLGRSMMLATISEEQLAGEGFFCCGSSSSSHQSLGLKRSSALSQSYKTGLAELAATQAHQQQQQGSVQQEQELLSAPEDNDCWGFFMDDQ